jgi:hypothetical protein
VILLLLAASAYSQTLSFWTPAPLPGPLAAVDLRPELGPPGNQYPNNTCSAFSAGCLGETLLSRLTGEPFRASAPALYAQAKRDYLDTPALESYRSIDGLPGYVAVRAIAGGLVPEGRPTEARRDYAFEPVAVRRTDLGLYLLTERKPVVMNLMWYMDAADNKTGRLRMPTAEERIRCRRWNRGCAGHVVTLVGYDPSAKEFIFRNSWGPGWGNGGYGFVPEAYVEKDCETCSYLKKLSKLDPGTREIIEAASYGWSGTMTPASR